MSVHIYEKYPVYFIFLIAVSMNIIYALEKYLPLVVRVITLAFAQVCQIKCEQISNVIEVGVD